MQNESFFLKKMFMIRLALPGAKSRVSFLDANSHGLLLEEEKKKEERNN